MPAAPDRPLAIGIDLGTTYSAIARLDASGRPVTIANAEGDPTTPSVILFEEGVAVVGKEALKAVATDAARTAQFVKRSVGEREYPKVIDHHRYPPEAMQALILNKLRRDAIRHVGPFTKCVITVPAYFDETRRKATQDAGYMAGLEVLDIINEPTAAAIAHGCQKGFTASKGANRPTRIMVYDLGGGTFDVTVVEMEGDDFITLATDGDVQLGGYDWDMRLVRLVAEAFQKQHGLDPLQDANAAGRLWRECEEAKRTLSARTKVLLHFDYRERTFRQEITRDTFESITADLLSRTRFTTRQTLEAAGLAWKEIDHVLLVGGSSRMPMVSRMLREASGKEPDGSVAVDEAVAHGAAIRAGILLAQGQGAASKIRIKNVNSHSLGIVGTDRRTSRRRNAILIPRNTRLPKTAQRSFRTQKEDQRSLYIEVIEGESSNPDECVAIGKCSIFDLPRNLPAQTPVDVRFTYSDAGRLEVHVFVHGTTKEIRHEFERTSGLNPRELEAWRSYIANLPVSS